MDNQDEETNEQNNNNQNTNNEKATGNMNNTPEAIDDEKLDDGE